MDRTLHILYVTVSVIGQRSAPSDREMMTLSRRRPFAHTSKKECGNTAPACLTGVYREEDNHEDVDLIRVAGNLRTIKKG